LVSSLCETSKQSLLFHPTALDESLEGDKNKFLAHQNLVKVLIEKGKEDILALLEQQKFLRNF